MGGLVRQLQHVIEAFARIRNVFFRETRKTRIQPETIERMTQVGRQALQLREQVRSVRIGRCGKRRDQECRFAHRVQSSSA